MLEIFHLIFRFLKALCYKGKWFSKFGSSLKTSTQNVQLHGSFFTNLIFLLSYVVANLELLLAWYKSLRLSICMWYDLCIQRGLTANGQECWLFWSWAYIKFSPPWLFLRSVADVMLPLRCTTSIKFYWERTLPLGSMPDWFVSFSCFLVLYGHDTLWLESGNCSYSSFFCVPIHLVIILF